MPTALNKNQVMDLTEFTGITNDGNKEERQRTFSQSTTTAPQNWMWEDDALEGAVYSLLVVEMSIGKFEYTSIEVRTLVILFLGHLVSPTPPTCCSWQDSGYVLVCTLSGCSFELLLQHLKGFLCGEEQYRYLAVPKKVNSSAPTQA